MSSITQYMQQRHRDCDDLFARAETSADGGNWTDTTALWTEFSAKMEQHLCMEEQVLFPAFENETGHTQGPTAVMRMEHEQMRALMKELVTCVNNEDRERFLGLAESLLLLIQQHNMKEEQMLYPMTDQALNDVDSVLTRMQTLGEA